jgi:hypothetical protein
MFKSQARVSPHLLLISIIHILMFSAPGLVFWFADAEASSATSYPPTTFRWIDNQKEAEEAVDAARKKAARRASVEE